MISKVISINYTGIGKEMQICNVENDENIEECATFFKRICYNLIVDLVQVQDFQIQ